MKDFAGTPLEVGDIVVCKGASNLHLARIKEASTQENTVTVNLLDSKSEKEFLFPEFYVVFYSSDYRGATLAHVTELWAKKGS